MFLNLFNENGWVVSVYWVEHLIAPQYWFTVVPNISSETLAASLCTMGGGTFLEIQTASPVTGKYRIEDATSKIWHFTVHEVFDA
jgi:hypothetical protein